MPFDSSSQGEYLTAQWLSDFRPTFSPDLRARMARGFGQQRIREPLRIYFASSPPQTRPYPRLFSLTSPVSFPVPSTSYGSSFPTSLPTSGTTTTAPSSNDTDATGGNTTTSGTGTGMSNETDNHTSVPSTGMSSMATTSGGGDTTGGNTTGGSGTVVEGTTGGTFNTVWTPNTQLSSDSSGSGNSSGDSGSDAGASSGMSSANNSSGNTEQESSVPLDTTGGGGTVSE